MKVYSTKIIPRDIFFSSELSTKMLGEYIGQIPLVTRFCREKKTRISRIETTDEQGLEELMDIFNDDLGGYTIQGIKKSLEKIKP